MDLLDRLLGHDAWSTGRLIEQSRGLTDAQLDQEFSLGWRTVRATLDHIVENMEVWTDLMDGVAPYTLPETGAPTLDRLQERLDTVAPRLAALAQSVRERGGWDEDWTDILDDPPARKTYGGGIVHVITHSMHHRAQLIHMLKELGVPGVIEGDALSWEEAQRTRLGA